MAKKKIDTEQIGRGNSPNVGTRIDRSTQAWFKDEAKSRKTTYSALVREVLATYAKNQMRSVRTGILESARVIWIPEGTTPDELRRVADALEAAGR